MYEYKMRILHLRNPCPFDHKSWRLYRREKKTQSHYGILDLRF